MKIDKQFLKQLIAPAIFFGLAGVLWGWTLYKGEWETVYPLIIWAAFYIAIFGGLGLSIESKDIKKILKTVFIGLIGAIIGFFIASIGYYFLADWFILVLSLFIPQMLSDVGNQIMEIILSVENHAIGIYFFNFLIVGFLISFFLSILYSKTKKWSMTWRGGLWFGIAALISPMFGNIIGKLFNSVFLSYLITFSLISIIFGIALEWAIFRNQKV